MHSIIYSDDCAIVDILINLFSKVPNIWVVERHLSSLPLIRLMFFCGDRTFNLWKPGINIIQNQNARAVRGETDRGKDIKNLYEIILDSTNRMDNLRTGQDND